MREASGDRRLVVSLVVYPAAIALAFVLNLLVLRRTDSDLLPAVVNAFVLLGILRAARWIVRWLAPGPVQVPVAALPLPEDRALGRVTLVALGPRPTAVARVLRRRGFTRELAARVTDGSQSFPVRVATAVTDVEADLWRRELEKARARVAVEL
ncbi:hypothetical protein [Cellulomonas sp. PhB150]|uniref:hypothetical protein n=1 Tax=Cellulomonas sp. PhB150 TaxID=2485188 RepID=UPI000F49CFEC|nr:hypothetical protein [Cellulomonas sp. PhB150]ROS31640.1 hypothetical protein EDF34_1303 [Cellulomonas sp. PhB150]